MFSWIRGSVGSGTSLAKVGVTVGVATLCASCRHWPLCLGRIDDSNVNKGGTEKEHDSKKIPLMLNQESKAEALRQTIAEESRMVLFKYIRNAASVRAESAAESTDSEDESIHEKKVGFRSRKIIEYENRIRQYSTPDKIFRYFATYKVMDDHGHGEVMMTPEDFLRSITPGVQQPEHLGLDQFQAISAEEVAKLTTELGVGKGSIFHQLGAGGLISFSDYMFLLTVLSTSRRHFEIAFKMFDLDGNGKVDCHEFEVVTNLMRSQSSTGARHRDHNNTGSTFKGINSGLITYFFGSNHEGILTVEAFLDFQRRLQNEILALEFRRKCHGHGHPNIPVTTSPHAKGKGIISELDFAELLIAYAGFSSKKRSRMLKRVRKTFEGDSAKGVSMDDFLSFYQVLYSINDVDTALTFHHLAGAHMEPDTLRHVARTVAGVNLSEHVLSVVFVLFDENGDGKLSNKEFVSVMKQRAMRGLEKPKDTGIGRVFSAMTKCAMDTRPTILGGIRKTE